MAEEALTPPPTRLQRARKAYSVVGDILTPTRILLFVTALALVIAGSVGGWERVVAVEEDTPSIAVGEPASAAPFEFTVHRLRVGDELSSIATVSETHHYLFLLLDVTNTTDEVVSLDLLHRAVELEFEGWPASSGRAGPRPTNYRGLDAFNTTHFQPGVLTPTVLVWQLDRSAPVPGQVTVNLNAFTWRYSIVEESDGWFDPAAAFTLSLPAEPLEAQ